MAGWTHAWSVRVSGRNISGALRPRLISITVTDKAGTESDTLAITVDDKNGQFRLPDERARILAHLDGVKVFEGIVDKVQSRGNRSGGRKLSINAKGYDTKGKAKEKQAFHMDDTTLGAFLERAASNAGFTIDVHPDLAGLSRDYWAADHESFAHLGQRMARELNATFKLQEPKAVFVPRGRDLGLQTITGTYGGNLIGWDIEPLRGRAVHKASESRWFDRAIADWRTERADIGLDRPARADNRVGSAVADKGQADAVNQGRKGEAEQGAGEGTVTLQCTPEARAEAPFMLVGARPGVDGTYRIETVTHTGNRKSGNITRCALKQPKGGAGKDTR